MQWIDSHCHLNLFTDPETVIQVARAAQVTTLITISTELESLPHLEALSQQHPDLYYTLGIHPDATHLLTDDTWKTLQTLPLHPQCCAIGEIGLDYYREPIHQHAQITWLERQLDLALQKDLPVVIHSRNAEQDLYPYLKAYALKKRSYPGVIHCFTGSLDFEKKCLDLGFFISFSGIVTFKKAEDVRQAVRLCPLQQLLIETDAPFLAPVPFRGKPCEPSMLPWTAKTIAELHHLPLEELARITSHNTQQVFHLR